MTGVVAYLALIISGVTLAFTIWVHRRTERQVIECEVNAAKAIDAANRTEAALAAIQEIRRRAGPRA